MVFVVVVFLICNFWLRHHYPIYHPWSKLLHPWCIILSLISITNYVWLVSSMCYYHKKDIYIKGNQECASPFCSHKTSSVALDWMSALLPIHFTSIHKHINWLQPPFSMQANTGQIHNVTLKLTLKVYALCQLKNDITRYPASKSVQGECEKDISKSSDSIFWHFRKYSNAVSLRKKTFFEFTYTYFIDYYAGSGERGYLSSIPYLESILVYFNNNYFNSGW